MFQTHRHLHTIRPLTTAHLAQTMSLLSLTAGELRQQIEAELASNPALELVEERRCPTCHRILPGKSVCPACSRQKNSTSDEPIVFVSPKDQDYHEYSGGSFNTDDSQEDRYAASVEELPVYVFRQVKPDIDPQDRKIAAHLLTNLNEDGLLAISLMDASRYLHVPISRIEKVQRIIQRADPLGVSSCSTRQALIVQLQVLGETHRVPPLAETIIQDGMSLLSRRQYIELARQLKAPLSQVQEAARFISENLNPFPARSSWGERHQPGHEPAGTGIFYQPDMIITQLNEKPGSPLVVEIIMPLYGTLRVNPLFRQAMQESFDEQKEALREDMDRAALFVKCLQQRNHTIQRLMHKIVTLQREFILCGEKHLRPLTRAFIARELGVHESTISRAVANKAVQMPNGRIVPLSCFFDRSLSVRTVLREIIAQEDSPLSDSQLAEILSEQGYRVARRTVAKYRAMEGILPANLRTRQANANAS